MNDSFLTYAYTILIIGVPWALATWPFLHPKIRFWLLGPQRRRLIPWGGIEVLAILFFTQIVWSGLVFAVLPESRVLDHFYGAGFTESYRQDTLHGVPKLRMSLWVSALAFPLNIATILLIPMLARKAQPYQLGLTRRRWAWNLAASILFFVAITPPVYAVNYVADRLVTQVSHQEPVKHPFDEITQQADSKAEWILVGFAVLFVAPVYEELFFRGILQGWLSQRAWGGFGAFLIALFLSVLFNWNHLQSAWTSRDWTALAQELQPLGFVLATCPALVMIHKLKKPGVAGAIYGSGLLFAIAHTSVWPSPIPLFFLGLGLGWLAFRSQSLVGPFMVHSLFNAVGFLLMIFRT
jgi:membrane protease YdiL (CAAX protease family)